MSICMRPKAELNRRYQIRELHVIDVLRDQGVNMFAVLLEQDVNIFSVPRSVHMCNAYILMWK
jgi:hypothetical protein